MEKDTRDGLILTDPPRKRTGGVARGAAKDHHDDEGGMRVPISTSAEDEALALMLVSDLLETEVDTDCAEASVWASACVESSPSFIWGKATRRELFEGVFAERLATLATSAHERALWRCGDRRLVAWRGLALATPTVFGPFGPERPPKGALSSGAEQDIYGAEPRLAARLIAALGAAFAAHAHSAADSQGVAGVAGRAA